MLPLLYTKWQSILPERKRATCGHKCQDDCSVLTLSIELQSIFDERVWLLKNVQFNALSPGVIIAQRL